MGKGRIDTRRDSVKIGLAVGLVFFLIVLAVLSPIVFNFFVATTPDVPNQSLAEQIGATPTSDQLIPPVEALKQIKDKDAKLLSEYAWVDHKAGIVRVPIERAMDEMVRGGPR